MRMFPSTVHNPPLTDCATRSGPEGGTRPGETAGGGPSAKVSRNSPECVPAELAPVKFPLSTSPPRLPSHEKISFATFQRITPFVSVPSAWCEPRGESATALNWSPARSLIVKYSGSDSPMLLMIGLATILVVPLQRLPACSVSADGARGSFIGGPDDAGAGLTGRLLPAPLSELVCVDLTSSFLLASSTSTFAPSGATIRPISRPSLSRILMMMPPNAIRPKSEPAIAIRRFFHGGGWSG